jgi:hypothetical protein
MELVVNKLLILRGFFFADWPFHSTIIFIVELLECFTSTSWRSTGKNMSRIFYQKPAPFVFLHLHDAPPTCALLELLVLEVLMFFSL